MLEGLFGYSLPDDLLSGTGLRILEGVILSIPIIGTYLSFFLFGGQFPGNDIIPRLYIIHVLLIPALILGLVTAHLLIMWHQKHTQMPGKGRTDKNVVGQPFYPYFMAKTGACFFFIFGVLALLSTIAQINPIWLYGPYTPASISAGSQPDFYMGFLEGTLRVFPSWTWDGRPYRGLERADPRPRAARDILHRGRPVAVHRAVGDRGPRGAPCQRPAAQRARPGPRSGWRRSRFYLIFLLEGANDLIADYLHIPLYTVTWIARFAVFLGPAVAYFVTKRICLGLQRKDRELLHHGLETGIIRQLPTGEFIEVHRPVSEDKRAVLLSNKEPLPLPRRDRGRERRSRPGRPRPDRQAPRHGEPGALGEGAGERRQRTRPGRRARRRGGAHGHHRRP